ncbi:MAG: hypothetical protein GY794_05530 [bacterium]|nr:hypothetical protein [bacterium]
MKYISIQLHPDKVPSLNVEEALSVLNNVGMSPEITGGDGDGEYINLSIESDNLKESWSVIKTSLLQMPGIERSSIIVCQGAEGWDDYLLLHHFDLSEKIDEL